jgi:hypothetical protein
MGLDQYLEKRTFIGAEYEYRNATGTIDITVEGKHLPIDFKRVSSINERVAYWRKANAIHQWFVDNVQDGEDDCKQYYVDQDQLKELLDLVNDVIKSLKDTPKKTIQIETGWKSEEGVAATTYADEEVFTNTAIAEDLLPTSTGFFFGSYEYDGYYLEDLEYTKKVLEETLSEPESWEVSYYYESSW